MTLYFTAYDTTYLWRYNVSDGTLKSVVLPVESSFILAIVVNGSEVTLISVDGDFVVIYSKSYEGLGDWSRVDAPIELRSHINNITNATWQGKPGGYLLITDDFKSEVYLL